MVFKMLLAYFLENERNIYLCIHEVLKLQSMAKILLVLRNTVVTTYHTRIALLVCSLEIASVGRSRPEMITDRFQP